MKTYGCLSCNGTLYYNYETGKLKCESCDNEFLIGEVQPYLGQQQRVCPSCGSLIEQPNLISCFCEACGGSLIDEGNLSTMYRPNFVAPHTLSMDKAQEKLRKWIKKKWLMPSRLRKELRINSSDRWLMPFWCYDFDNKGVMIFRATKVRKYSTSKYIVTETKHYNVKVRGRGVFNKIPVDAMIELDDTLMDCIAPFNNSTLIPFYDEELSGTQSKKYDFDQNQMFGRGLKMAKDFTKNFMVAPVNKEFTTAVLLNDEVNYDCKKFYLVYYPLYCIKCDFEGEERQFYINGQTGKIAGDTPISKAKLIMVGVITTIILFIAPFITGRIIYGEYFMSMMIPILFGFIFVGAFATFIMHTPKHNEALQGIKVMDLKRKVAKMGDGSEKERIQQAIEIFDKCGYKEHKKFLKGKKSYQEIMEEHQGEIANLDTNYKGTKTVEDDIEDDGDSFDMV